MSAPWADTGDGVLLEHLSVATGAMMFIVSLKPKTLWVNDALVEQTGYTFEDYAFERFENPFIPPEDIAVVLAELTRFLASDDGVSREVRNRFVDRWGGTLHVRSRIAKILWKGEQALLYTTYLAGPDQAQAVELEQRYRSLVEAATDAIVRLTPALTVQFSNRSFQALVGKPPLELNSLRFTDLVAQSHRAELHRQLTSDAVTIAVNVPVSSADGQEAWLEGTFVRTTVGPHAGMLQAILRDTTEKRRLDARVQQAQKRETLGQLAGGIAHDLNNILTGVLGSATLAEEALRRGQSAAEPLADIRLAAQRAGELSSSMLAYAGEGNAQRVPLSLADLVVEMKPLLASALPKNVELQVTTPEGPLAVVGDENQLRQVIMNLIINAADASRQTGGAVEVSAGVRAVEDAPRDGVQVFGDGPTTGRVAFVLVEDRGTGMSPQLVTRIFDPFFSTKARGRGLGLAAALGILGRHGGCVRVKSEPGRGTSMEVWLPLTDQPLRGKVKATDAASLVGGQGVVVLVVDDEAMIRRLARRALEQRGYQVLEAGCGEDALEVLRAHPEVQAVVLDQTMPGMGGQKTLEQLRKDAPTLPVVRTSGYSAEQAGGASDAHTHFLSKPFGTPQLLDVLRQALDRD
ncbi:MAG: response regulator [Myxococcus sp.]|nr:response regulator [Myxococcus sp.]